jgi:hypothetical protein
MTGRSKFWLVIAAIFTLINLAGAVYALALGEALHAAAHVALLFPGAYLMSRLCPRARGQDVTRAQRPDDRIEYLQQSVDAMALEVERIGEAQRFSDKLRAERSGPPLKQDQ